MKTTHIGIGIAAIVLLVAGCGSIRNIRTYEQLRDAAPGPLRALARDRTIYELATYTVLDSALQGEGTHIVQGARSPFAGRLPYRDLVYIESRQGGFWRTADVVLAVMLTGSFLANARQYRGLEIYSIGGGESCPYIYVWDGGRYVLQGEAFGRSIGKALEGATTCMLPAAAARDGALRARLTNERPETHYVNRVRLLAFEAPAGSTVGLDTENRAWPVFDPRPPRRPWPGPSRELDASRAPGADAAECGTGYRDSLELTLPHPKGAGPGSLIVRAINTDLVYTAFALIFGYLGEQSLSFLYEVEHDPELVRTLQTWIEECSLSVELRQGGRWTHAGAIAPEASAVPFSRIVRIDATGVTDDSIRVRLSTLADGWRINAVEVDWTPAAPLEAHPVAMRSALHSGGGSVAERLRDADESYAVIFPGERIDLSFDAYPASALGKIAYALDVSGYLHEWPPASESTACVSLRSGVPGFDRLAFVNDLVRHRDALLPLVYAQWRR